MNDNIQIRKLLYDQMDEALALVWDVFQEFEAPDYSEQGVKSFFRSIHEAEWLSMLTVYGAFRKDELVGVIATRSTGQHIALFFVKGACHRQGIGRKLFEYMLADNPQEILTVNSSPYAVKVYERLGFAASDQEQIAGGIRYIPMKRQNYKIIKYSPQYEDRLMDLIRQEGEDWTVYWQEPNATKYRKCFEKQATYLAVLGDKVCGYSRSLVDALYIYVCDLLVNKEHRGNGLGERLMRCLKDDYPGLDVYIMSGNDQYYKTIDCKKEGSIYLLK